MVTGGGGPAANAAVALRRLGADVRLVTVLSDDIVGRAHLDRAGGRGVDSRASDGRPTSRSPLAVIRVDPRSGERRIYWERGDCLASTPSESAESWLDGADLLYCDAHEAPAAAVLAPRPARRGLPVVHRRRIRPRRRGGTGGPLHGRDRGPGFARALTGVDDHGRPCGPA